MGTENSAINRRMKATVIGVNDQLFRFQPLRYDRDNNGGNKSTIRQEF